MGLGSLLGKIGLGAADLFTGGLASKIGNPIIDKISGAGGAGSPAEGFANVGKVLGGFAEGEANNRQSRGNLTQGYDRLMLGADDNRRQAEGDLVKRMAQTSYVKGGGNPYTAPAGFQSFGFGPKATSPEQQQAAGTLQGQLMNRLNTGNLSYTPTPVDQYADRGLLEKIANYTGAGLAGIGSFMKPTPQRSPYPLNDSDPE